MRATTAAVLLTCVLTNGVQAQDPEPLGNNQVRRVLMLALDNIARARCDGAQPCAPATAEEKANPPITLPEARTIMRRGILSGIALQCALDWQARNFVPMMAYWREDQQKNERQMALVSLVHGIAQGTVGETGCTDQMRESLGRQLTFRP